MGLFYWGLSSVSRCLFLFGQEWGLEGYQLWMVCQEEPSSNGFTEAEEESHSITNVMQLQFVKSALTVNPCLVCFAFTGDLASYSLKWLHFFKYTIAWEPRDCSGEGEGHNDAILIQISGLIIILKYRFIFDTV